MWTSELHGAGAAEAGRGLHPLPRPGLPTIESIPGPSAAALDRSAADDASATASDLGDDVDGQMGAWAGAAGATRVSQG